METEAVSYLTGLPLSSAWMVSRLVVFLSKSSYLSTLMTPEYSPMLKSAVLSPDTMV